MKGIEDWKEAEKTYERGDLVRLMLGQARWIDGLWNGDSIMVDIASQALSGDVKKDDLITYDGRSGFIRFRRHYRNITLNVRNYLLIALEDTISGDDEE